MSDLGHWTSRLQTRSDLEAEFEEARAEERVPRFSGHIANADLSGLDFSSLYRTDLGRYSGVYSEISLIFTRMRNCNLTAVDLGHSDLTGADLTGSILRESNLGGALLQYTKLDEADLTGADLRGAKLDQVSLARANLKNTMFGLTGIHRVDLSTAIGLAETGHYLPSAIDSLSLRLTARGLVKEPDFRRRDFFVFLSSAGIDDELLDVVRPWVGQPIEFHSIFLSHSTRDKEFARQLYRDLRGIGIKCWLDEKELLPGDSVIGEIDKGIKLWDRLLLVCSRNSLGPTTGWWVEQELERALAKERELRRQGVSNGTVVPITIDDYVFDEWDGKYRGTLLERYIGDFRDYRPEAYAESFTRLVEGLDRSRRP